jgi:hypothetical protein
MEKSINFATIRRVQALIKTLDYPLVEAVAHAETNGFSLFRPFLIRTASPIQGHKSRFIPLIHTRGTLANKAAMLTSINLLNLSQGLTCKPVREPKLYYTDTSFDAIGRVSQSSLGGRGLTYFFLTYYLPFPFFCNYLNLPI